MVAIILFRELQGVAVGLSSAVCPTYVAELAPVRFRGSLGVSFQLSITFGIFVSYIVSLLFTSVPGDFRWMFGLSVVPGLMMCASFFLSPMPPSERRGREISGGVRADGLGQLPDEEPGIVNLRTGDDDSSHGNDEEVSLSLSL